MKNLRTALDPAAFAEIQSRDIEKEILPCMPLMHLSAVYDTWSKAETPEALKSMWDASSAPAISISIIAATIGVTVQEQIRVSKEQGDPDRAALLTAVALESLEQSFHFVLRLITDEAKDDACELSPLMPVPQELLTASLTVLDAQKADIVIQDGALHPLYSAVRFCVWNPVKKKNARAK